MDLPEGIVYILHFSEKIYHAQHYVGFCQKLNPNLYNRIEKHWKGKSRVALMKKVSRKKINFVVAKIYLGVNQDFERDLKNKKKSSLYCPVCRGEHYLPENLPWFDPKDHMLGGIEKFVIEAEVINLNNSSGGIISQKF
jgi:hypothetical protein